MIIETGSVIRALLTRQERKGFFMRKKNRLNNQKKRKRRPFWMFAGSVILIFYFFCTVLHISDSSDKEQLVSPVVSDSTVSYKADTGTSYVSSAGLDKSNTFPEDAWNLILVNPWNSLPENYSVSLTYLENDQAVDSRCYPDLQDMIDACRAEGLSPVICSSYRTWEYQET